MAEPAGNISGFLARTRALVYRHEAERAITYAIAALGGIAIALPLVGMLVGVHRARALAVLGIAGLGAAIVVIAAIVIGLVAPRRRYSGDAALARWVGTRHEPIASDLLSSVELTSATARPGAPSAELVGALVESTADKLAALEPHALIPATEVPRARWWAFGALAANVALVALAPHVVATGWRRLVHAPRAPYDGAALSNVPLVGDLDATLTAPAYAKRKVVELPSSSGDLRGLPGTAVTLTAKVLVPAAAAELVIESPDGGGQPRTVPATLDGQRLSAKLVIDRSARYRFEITSPSGARSIEATPRAIEAEVDQPPAVQLLAPGDPLDVTNVKRVELAYTIEDDFAVTSADLVWESEKDHGRKPLSIGQDQARITGKLTWDIAEITVPSGGVVRYWIEAKDNDSVGGPNIGKSRELHLRVTSQRERHDETIGREQDVAEKLLHNLGTRLPGVPADDVREDLSRQLRDAIGELRAVEAAFDKDPQAAPAMRKALAQIAERLDHDASLEQRYLPKPGTKSRPGTFALIDPKLVGELEDDVIALADWLDRARMEGLLDITDEIAAHQKRLADLLAQFQRTKDPRLLDEIDREMRALDRAYTELAQHQKGMPEDVLDQYVHADAVHPSQGRACMDEVAALLHDGKTAAAQQKLEQCRAQAQHAADSLEGSLAQLRGDKFSDEQKKLDEVMNELADLAKDQDDIAAEANRLFEDYAHEADEVARDHKREAMKTIQPLVDKLRRRLAAIDDAGLTPFAKEEMDIVQKRLDDVDKMVADGDLAEALAMARQAKASLDTIAGELEAAQTDDPKSKWAEATQDAIDQVDKANPIAKELIEQLQALAPKPDQIMSASDQRAFDRLRRRQQLNDQRAKRLGDRTKQLGGELPGDVASELGKQLGTAEDHMGKADDRMKDRDPSGAREAARAAADDLARARDRARSAARQAQQNSVGDEPIRIPGADEYKAPEQFREDLLEAMKKKGTQAPEGYEDQIKRYYQELIK